jgi:hypothetical protein
MSPIVASRQVVEPSVVTTDGQVYTLEKVLKIKKDPITQTEFLDDVMKVSSILGSADRQRLDEKPSFTFWTTLAHAFETQTKEAARSKSIQVCQADDQHQTGCSKPSVPATLVC